jgi:hypothetical protein
VTRSIPIVRLFFSPAERRVLDSLPSHEAAVIEALHEEFDATLVGEEHAAQIEQPTLFDVAA